MQKLTEQQAEALRLLRENPNSSAPELLTVHKNQMEAHGSNDFYWQRPQGLTQTLSSLVRRRLATKGKFPGIGMTYAVA